MRCPACAEGHLAAFFDMGQVPVFANVLAASRDEALGAACGALELGICSSCALIFNLAFDPERVAYSPAYENSLHFSPHFQRWAKGLAERLVKEHRLEGREALEIGCGKGEFLALLIEAGCGRGIGFDASFDPSILQEKPAGVEFVAEGFADPDRVPAADLVCARHVLEHIAEPAVFVGGLRRAVGRRADARLYLEVPDALYSLRDLGIWDLIYEHCAYYTAPSLETLLRRQGFAPQRIASEYGEQFLCADARPADADPDFAPGLPADHVRELAAEFAARFEEKAAHWREELGRLAATGRNVVLWGAGSKGVSFLNVVGREGPIRAVVDLNPRKHGRFVPGTGHPVVPPQAIRELGVDVALVMNPVYADEIRGTLSELGSDAEVAVV